MHLYMFGICDNDRIQIFIIPLQINVHVWLKLRSVKTELLITLKIQGSADISESLTKWPVMIKIGITIWLQNETKPIGCFYVWGLYS